MIILTRIAKFVQACLILGFLFSIIPSVSSAAVTKKVDEFDGQTRIISALKDTDENIKPPFFSDLIFQKSFKNNETPELSALSTVEIAENVVEWTTHP